MADSLNLGRDWDKTFPLSPAVEHSKAVFRNRFGIELAADVYVPKGASGRLPAIAVWPLRRGKGAGLGPICPSHGGAGLPDVGL